MFELATETDRGTLRVVFVREGDRFAHRFELVHSGVVTLLAQSVEGTSDDAWPTSPAVQEVHQQGDLLFLTGAAGTSYWSASVAAAEPGVIEFDSACRCKQAPQWLGMTYEVLAPQFGASPVLNCDLRRESTKLTIDAKTPSEPGTVRWVYRVSVSCL